MAQATVKLFASLGGYLPSGSHENAFSMALPDPPTIGGILASLKVPREQCHLVLVNGTFVPPSLRSDKRLHEGDTLAVWPPVAGG